MTKSYFTNFISHDRIIEFVFKRATHTTHNDLIVIFILRYVFVKQVEKERGNT